MGVEEHEAERAVDGGVRPELAEHDQVVPPEAERARSRADDRLERVRDLPHGPSRVPGRDRDVAEIRDRQRAEHLRSLRGVVGAERDRGRANRLGAESCPGTVRRRRVEGDAEHGDVDALGVVDERAPREGLDAGVPRGGERVGRPVAGSVLSRHAATVPPAREYPGAVRALLVPLAIAALVGGCGSGSSSGTDATTSLTVTYQPAGAEGGSETWTLSCDPAGGTLPDPDFACGHLAVHGAELFAPVPGDTACTQIYGGPQVAQVEGTVGGEPVSETFSRTNGCEISRWDALSPWLLPPGGVN